MKIYSLKAYRPKNILAGIFVNRTFKGSSYLKLVAFLSLLAPLQTQAINLYYEFDLSDAQMSYEASVSSYERSVGRGNQAIGRATFRTESKAFTENDRLVLHVDTKNQDLNLYGTNSGKDSCVDGPCLAGTEDSLVSQSLLETLVGTQIQFGMKLFHNRDWRIENDFDGDGTPDVNEFNAAPLNFNTLAANPEDLFAEGIWNEESFFASTISEQAGAGGRVYLPEIQRTSLTSFPRLAQEHTFAGGQNNDYSIKEDQSSFSVFDDIFNVVAKKRFQISYYGLNLGGLGAVSYIGNSMDVSDPVVIDEDTSTILENSVENPEPATVLLLVAALAFIALNKKRTKPIA